MHTFDTKPDIVDIQPEIDIISVKMLSVLGYDTSPLTFKVRRRLFGCCSDTADSSTVSESLIELETEDVQRSSEVWNFDFYTESPLPAGRYAWERVRNCDVPGWYRSEDSPDHRRSWCVKVDQSSKPSDCDECKQTSESGQESKPTLNSRTQRFVQTSIKGYTKVQKKRSVKRLDSKRCNVKFLKGPSRVANYFLRNQDESTKS